MKFKLIKIELMKKVEVDWEVVEGISNQAEELYLKAYRNIMNGRQTLPLVEILAVVKSIIVAGMYQLDLYFDREKAIKEVEDIVEYYKDVTWTRK